MLQNRALIITTMFRVSNIAIRIIIKFQTDCQCGMTAICPAIVVKTSIWNMFLYFHVINFCIFFFLGVEPFRRPLYGCCVDDVFSRGRYDTAWHTQTRTVHCNHRTLSFHFNDVQSSTALPSCFRLHCSKWFCINGIWTLYWFGWRQCKCLCHLHIHFYVYLALLKIVYMLTKYKSFKLCVKILFWISLNVLKKWFIVSITYFYLFKLF